MAKKIMVVDKFARNTAAIEAFKSSRNCYSEITIVWTTYCKVTCDYGGIHTNETFEIAIRKTGGVYTHVEVRGFQMEDSSLNAVFSVRQASITYENDNLVIQGTRDGLYYKVLIGAYDAEYVSNI